MSRRWRRSEAAGAALCNNVTSSQHGQHGATRHHACELPLPPIAFLFARKYMYVAVLGESRGERLYICK